MPPVFKTGAVVQAELPPLERIIQDAIFNQNSSIFTEGLNKSNLA